MRISQLWAGAGWGTLFIPRVGHEVIVDFLEGDPDRPIITGRVYNGINKPPYGLPRDKTKSTIKSHSSPGGGGFNELRFEDKKGNEEVYLHGERDWNILIKHDKDQRVGRNEHLHVRNNRTKIIGLNHKEKVGANKYTKVGVNHCERVGVNKSEAIGAAKELSIGGLYQVSVGGVMNETVAGAKSEEVGGYKAELVGGYNQITVGADLTEDVGGNATLNAKGKVTNTAEEITLTANTKLTLICGGSTILLDPSGITITATLIKINS